jgi:integrase
MLFKYAWDRRMVPAPLPYEHALRSIDKKQLRRQKQQQEAVNGKKVFTAEQIRDLIDKGDLQMRAMIYLGINCGLGNHDCGRLPIHFLDLDSGELDYPRPKTGIERRCPLWPETVEAIREYLPSRKEPKFAGHRHLLFVTKYGQPWYKETRENPVARQFAKLVKEADKTREQPIYRRGYGFYLMRHTFETIAQQTGDQVAVNAIMGHADGSMADSYRHDIWNSRLKAVVAHVHAWLFGESLTK